MDAADLSGLLGGWALLAVPLAFAFGWVASRLDLRQWRRSGARARRSSMLGLDLLLDDDPDRAIDAFVDAARRDPDAVALHFALGRLLRRRGDFDRAIRVHEHLLLRAELRPSERERAQRALADDFVQAGLLDRAEVAWRALVGTAHDAEARLALLALHERARDWRAAADAAAALERDASVQTAGGSFARRIAHHLCEQAADADARGDRDAATARLAEARRVAPDAPRPIADAAQRALASGDAAAAAEAFGALAAAHPATFARLADDVARTAAALSGEAGDGAADRLVAALRDNFDRRPTLDVLRALASLDGMPSPAAHPGLTRLLREQPSLAAAAEALSGLDGTSTDPALVEAARDAVASAARQSHRWRCAACGFEAQRHFWQCPGCLGWDTFPPQRLDEPVG